MPIVQRPTRDVLWSEGGNQTEPSTEKQELGWVIEKPPYEEMNWIHYQQDLTGKYLFQRGWAEWYVEEDYPISGCVQYNGKYYKALLENKGKQPDINPSIWTQAFSDYQLTLDVKSIIETVNYADKLVYKDNPIFRSKAIGTCYEASVGVEQQKGYVFKGFSFDGLFHNGIESVMVKGGDEVARFSPVTNILENTKRVVTMDVLQRALENAMRYKVGDLYLTTNLENPNSTLGYGTWVRYGEGRAIIGAANQATTTPDWTKIVNNIQGSYTHTQTVQEMPRHRHHQGVKDTGTGRIEGYSGNAPQNDNFSLEYTEYEGEGRPFNIVQPSVVVNVWRRTA